MRPAPRLIGALLAVSLALPVVLLAPRSASAVPCRTSGPGSGAYTVTVCFTAPAARSTVSGAVSVETSVSVTSGRAVRHVQFFVGGGYVLTDYEEPWRFSLPSARWLDGETSMGVRAVVKGKPDYATPKTTMKLTLANGGPAPLPPAFEPRVADPEPGTPLLVAATGDGANGRVKAKAVVQRIAGWDPDLFLYLGDVYARGTHTEFANWFAPTKDRYGRFHAITNPTIGNHEYQGGPGAAPYFAYWGDPPHTYSFDAGGWHLVSLDSTLTYAQTTPGTDQFEWLRHDLRTAATACTLVFFHHPVFSLGDGNEDARLLALWALLAEEGVDLVLTGHAHQYTRWRPLGADRTPSPDGPVQITVGTGGHFLYPFIRSDARAAVGVDDRFGALRLELVPESASFRFIAAGGKVLDDASRTCSPRVDHEPPSAPVATAQATGPTAALIQWTASTDDVGVTGYAIQRDGLQVGEVDGETRSFLDGSLAPSTAYTYVVVAVDASGKSTASEPVIVTTGDDT